MAFLARDPSSAQWWYTQISTFMAIGSLILGLIILIRQPHQRIGWLWIIYGFAVGFNSLGNSLYYYRGFQPSGYSALEYFLLWFTEPANLATLICPILLMLWFPDGGLVSRRWRLLYLWLSLTVIIFMPFLFVNGPDWNGGESAGGIVIDNPFGWLPVEEIPFFIGFGAFISIILITLLAVVSLVFRYRSSGQLVRLQLRWFVWGGFLYIFFNFIPVSFFDINQTGSGFQILMIQLSAISIIWIYLAVGLAILRYRLFDIDIIIRKTLQYALLTGLLALVFFGSVILLQSLVENLTGEQSPLVIVLSTLAIAALFNPLRIRIQNFIDRRFYRKKYNAEQALSQFSATARDEVDMDKLTAALLDVVGETMQSESLSLWLKQEKNTPS